MVGYPYSYNDYLSEEEAMKRRVEFVDKVLSKGIVLSIFWSLMSASAFAADLPVDPVISGTAVDAPVPSPKPAVFAPVAGICKCSSPAVKTGILLAGVSLVCYSAFCSKDKVLLVACSSLGTYAITNLDQ